MGMYRGENEQEDTAKVLRLQLICSKVGIKGAGNTRPGLIPLVWGPGDDWTI